MKHYIIYIKSHSCKAPDYEDACSANSLDEAASIFAIKMSKYDSDWEVADLKEYIQQVDSEQFEEGI